MDSKGFGEFWDITILVASLITVIVYVAETELESIGANSSSDKETISMALVWLDFVCTLLFFIDFILQTLASVPMYGKFCGVPTHFIGLGLVKLILSLCSPSLSRWVYLKQINQISMIRVLRVCV